MLEKNKIRETPFRVEVLDLFTSSKNALSLKEIESQLKEFDRITLYRTLKLFIKTGIIHEILHSNGKKYALCQEECDEYEHKHNHLHFHCSKCNESFCVDSKINDLELPGYTIEHSDLSVYGVCNKCNS